MNEIFVLLIPLAFFLSVFGTLLTRSSDECRCALGSFLTVAGCVTGLAALLLVSDLLEILEDKRYIESLLFVGFGIIYHSRVVLRYRDSLRRQSPVPPPNPSV